MKDTKIFRQLKVAAVAVASTFLFSSMSYGVLDKVEFAHDVTAGLTGVEYSISGEDEGLFVGLGGRVDMITGDVDSETQITVAADVFNRKSVGENTYMRMGAGVETLVGDIISGDESDITLGVGIGFQHYVADRFSIVAEFSPLAINIVEDASGEKLNYVRISGSSIGFTISL